VRIVVAMRMSDEDKTELAAAAPDADLVAAAGREEVMQQIGNADAYVPGPWGEDVLAAGTRLRWVHFPWAGVETEVFPALARSDVLVTNSAGVFAVPMAEHVIGMMLALSRGLLICARRSPEQLWHAKGARRSVTERVCELNGGTLGIVGYGGIGRAVAERVKGLGMCVLGLRRRPEPDEFAGEVWGPDRLDELLRRSDCVVLSCALTDETRGLIGARELALMKPTALLVNVARGAVVDEPALIEALREGRLGGAGLDVTAQEPLPVDSPLWTMENVIVTPHVAGFSQQTRRRQFELLRENVRRFTAGEPLLNVVDKQAGY
jgi:phosphoglycerate dehydrogenase-like enzyme